jgi:hypothetical protein
MPSNFNYISNPLTALIRAGIHLEQRKFELWLQLTTADGLPSRPLAFCVDEVSAIPCKIYGLSNVN